MQVAIGRLFSYSKGRKGIKYRLWGQTGLESQILASGGLPGSTMEQDLYLGHTNSCWISEFAKRMQRLDYGSEEYTKCQKIYAFLANRHRLQDRVNIEAIKDGSNH